MRVHHICSCARTLCSISIHIHILPLLMWGFCTDRQAERSFRPRSLRLHHTNEYRQSARGIDGEAAKGAGSPQAFFTQCLLVNFPVDPSKLWNILSCCVMCLKKSSIPSIYYGPYVQYISADYEREAGRVCPGLLASQSQGTCSQTTVMDAECVQI